MESNNEAASAEVFEYTGKGCAVPKDVTNVRFHPTVIEVEDEAFSNCNKLREVVFNEDLQKIGWNAFYECRSLSSIVLPSIVTEIGIHAFVGCSNLIEVLFNNGLRKIGRGAFSNCISLPNITFPSTVTEIELHAFYNCYNLNEVVLYGIPREIGQYAFINCTSLERFTFPTISSRLDNLIQTGHWDEINIGVDTVHGVVERSGGDLFVSTQSLIEAGIIRSVLNQTSLDKLFTDLNKIVRLISYYEVKDSIRQMRDERGAPPANSGGDGGNSITELYISLPYGELFYKILYMIWLIML